MLAACFRDKSGLVPWQLVGKTRGPGYTVGLIANTGAGGSDFGAVEAIVGRSRSHFDLFLHESEQFYTQRESKTDRRNVVISSPELCAPS